MDALNDNDEEALPRDTMNNVDNGTLKLPPEETQSSYERVLEWNNQAERDEIPSRDAFKRRPEDVSPLPDDMALPSMNDSDLFDVITYGHGRPEEMEQGKSSFVNVEDIPHDIYLDEPMSVISDDTEGAVFANYLKCRTCYDIVPKSAKIVIFDTRLLVKKAFYALVANGVRSAPLWDNTKQDYVGMLTISDFINILVSYYKSPLVQMEEVEEHRIETWRDLSKNKLPSTLIQISPYQSLYEACEYLIKHKIHRLPVIDPSSSNFLFVITHKRILHYLHEHFSKLVMPDFMYKTLGELSIGTLCKIATINPETPLITALNMFAEYKVSALPIVDKDGKAGFPLAKKWLASKIFAFFLVLYFRCPSCSLNINQVQRISTLGSVICVVVDIRTIFFSKFGAEKLQQLGRPVIEALKHRAEGFEGVHRCRLNEPLHVVVERIVKAGVHRLVVVDKEDQVVGVMSLSDLLQVLVLHPPGVISATSEDFMVK
ncbi:5'-AMP-activated protein kinase subunit gamma-1-like [Dendronephthya gigantea]|uniref:5'-AMP-activated protein kinase subunit gamma-1-like n=1 Tax=Dendronephthya gigantea TaxID=151771 RepID=UPI00106A3009|nr:5'-AMP-activated protein kinase subunit gamma-1-like [Dendronephthya gigantea]